MESDDKTLQQFIDDIMEAHGGFWGEHPDYPVEDWQHEVRNDDTRVGYWEWVVNRVDDAEDDE